MASGQLEMFRRRQALGQDVVDPAVEPDRVFPGHDQDWYPEAFEPTRVVRMVGDRRQAAEGRQLGDPVLPARLPRGRRLDVALSE